MTEPGCVLVLDLCTGGSRKAGGIAEIMLTTLLLVVSLYITICDVLDELELVIFPNLRDMPKPVRWLMSMLRYFLSSPAAAPVIENPAASFQDHPSRIFTQLANMERTVKLL